MSHLLPPELQGRDAREYDPASILTGAPALEADQEDAEAGMSRATGSDPMGSRGGY